MTKIELKRQTDKILGFFLIYVVLYEWVKIHVLLWSVYTVKENLTLATIVTLTESLNYTRTATIISVPQTYHPQNIDPVYEQTLLEYWTPTLEAIKVKARVIEDLPTRIMPMSIDGVEWNLGPMDMNKRYSVPPWVYRRYNACRIAGVPFSSYLWGEEVQPPPLPKPQPYKVYDPIFIGIIATGTNRGIWCEIGKWFH